MWLRLETGSFGIYKIIYSTQALARAKLERMEVMNAASQRDDTVQKVIDLACDAHRTHWRMSRDEGTGDVLASLVTSTWQDSIKTWDDKRFAVECRIADHLKERIDVVDLISGAAFELKVSPNNVHMEFYRDVFKAIIARDHRVPQLRKFIFLAPQRGADKLQ